MRSPRAAATESCPVEQPYRSPVGGRAFSLAARRAVKRGAMCAYCHHWMPAWVVATLFRMFRLRGLWPVNYYEHHLGDYAKDAAHLSLIEDGAYRRLLDAYYTRELPLPGDIKLCCKLARANTKAERSAVKYVLGEFFELRDDGYHQSRADQEVARFQAKSEKAKRSAEARWADHQTHSERNASASPDAMRTHMRTHSEGNAPRARPQSPDPNHQEKIKIKPPCSAGAERFEEFWAAYPRKVGKANALKAWRKIAPNPETVATILAALRVQRASEQWRKDGGQFIPHPATWLNGRRWEDEAQQAAAFVDQRLAL